MTLTVRPLADPAHVRLDNSLALVIEGRGGLVKDEDPRIANECAPYGDALALTAGKRSATLPERRTAR